MPIDAIEIVPQCIRKTCKVIRQVQPIAQSPTCRIAPIDDGETRMCSADIAGQDAVVVRHQSTAYSARKMPSDFGLYASACRSARTRTALDRGRPSLRRATSS